MPEIKTYLDPLDLTDSCLADKETLWLENDVYAKVVGATVIPCVDAVVTVVDQPGIVYLTKRTVQPQRGLWRLGGRILRNMPTLQHAIAHNTKRETKMDFAPERFQFLAPQMAKFTTSAQGGSCESLILLYRLDLTMAELAVMSLSLVASEYEPGFGLQPFNRQELVAANGHQALLDMFGLIWS